VRAAGCSDGAAVESSSRVLQFSNKRHEQHQCELLEEAPSGAQTNNRERVGTLKQRPRQLSQWGSDGRE
jgi:hypothetical protein